MVWITGAGTGFGRAVAVMLAAAGARPVLSGRRAAKLDETREGMRALAIDPAAALALPCDITSDREVAAAAAHEIARQCGSIARARRLRGAAAAPARPLAAAGRPGGRAGTRSSPPT